MRIEIARCLQDFIHKKYDLDMLWPLLIWAYFDPILAGRTVPHWVYGKQRAAHTKNASVCGDVEAVVKNLAKKLACPEVSPKLRRLSYVEGSYVTFY